MKMIFFLICIFTSGLGYAQIRVNKIIIYAGDFRIINEYTNESKVISFDTTKAAFTFSISSNITTQNNSISWSYSNSYKDQNSNIDNLIQSINIVLDTDAKKIKSLEEIEHETYSYTYPNYYYHDDTYNNFHLNNSSYILSRFGDTLTLQLDSSSISNTDFTINNYRGHTGIHEGSGLVGSRLFKIESGAQINIYLIGTFPLDVKNTLLQSKSSLLNLDSKIVKIVESRYINTLNCFDLLGRKHPLEFLGSDGTSSTYSFRSLRPGVYFVNDGRGMVKFLVSE